MQLRFVNFPPDYHVGLWLVSRQQCLCRGPGSLKPNLIEKPYFGINLSHIINVGIINNLLREFIHNTS